MKKKNKSLTCHVHRCRESAVGMPLDEIGICESAFQ